MAPSSSGFASGGTNGSGSTTLRSALHLVSSDKVRDRTDGMEMIRQIFANRANCERLNAQSADGNGWLQVFQTVFGCVTLERHQAGRGSNKIGRAAAASRLSSAAGTVRWLVDRAAPYLTRKTVSAIFNHLTQSMIASGKFVEPIALDYVKALKSILSYQAHLDHLDERAWKCAMAICLDALVGRHVTFDHEKWDQEAQEDDPDVSLIQATSENAHSKAVMKTEITPVMIELAGLVPMLLKSSMAPILPPQKLESPRTDRIPAGCGLPLLRDLLSFFQTCDSETTCHRPLLIALNQVLTEIELNYIDEMSRYSKDILPVLVNLWPTRDVEVREQLLIALTIIMPFLSRVDDPSSTILTQDTLVSIVYKSLTDLTNVMMKDVGGKRGIMPLDTAYLTLRADADSVSSPTANPFICESIMAAPDFTPEMAISWAALNIQAEALTKIYRHVETSPSHSTSTPRASQKRRRIEDPISALLSSINTGRHPESRLLHVEVLFFLCARHWTAFHDTLRDEVKRSLLALLADTDLNVQQWSILCLATLLPLADSKELMDDNSFWNEVRLAIFRKTGLAAGMVSRSACLLAGMLIDRLDPAVLSASVAPLISELQFQGPPVAFDSACFFIGKLIRFSSQDPQLYRENVPGTAATWLVQAWQDTKILSANTTLATRGLNSFTSLVRLIEEITFRPIHVLDVESGPCLCYDSAIFIYLRNSAAHSDARNFALAGIIPRAQRDRPATLIVTPGDRSALLKPFLQHCTTAACSVLESGQAQTSGQFRHLCVCILIVVACSPMRCGKMSSICEISSDLLESMRSQMLSRKEQLFVLQAFEPFITPSQPRELPYVLQPGPFSGIVTVASTPFSVQYGASSPIQAENLWNRDETAELATMANQHVKQILQGLVTATISQGVPGDEAADPDDDMFGPPVSIAEDHGMPKGPDDPYLQPLLKICLDVSIQLRFTGRPVRDREILNLLLAASGDHFVALAESISLLISDELLEFRSDAAELTLSLAQEFLQSHQYAKSAAMHQAVGAILRALVPMWTAQKLSPEVMEMFETLWHWWTRVSRPCDWKERLHVIESVLDFMSFNPHDRATKDLLTSRIEDSDYRVRFRTASAAPAIFLLDGNVPGRYRSMADRFHDQGGNLSVLASRLLCLMNISIASSDSRAAALFHYYDTISTWPRVASLGNAVYSHICSTLSVDASTLFLAFAPGILPVLNENHDPSRLPMAIYGYSSKFDWARDVIDVCGPVLSAFEADSTAALWTSLLAITRMEDIPLQPSAVAIRLAFCARDFPERSQSTLHAKLREILEAPTTTLSFHVCVVAETVLLLSDQHHTLAPSVPSDAGNKVLHWLMTEVIPATDAPKACLHVLEVLGSRITSAFLLIERQRQFHNLQRFIETYFVRIKDRSVLKKWLRVTAKLYRLREIEVFPLLKAAMLRVITEIQQLRETTNFFLEAAEAALPEHMSGFEDILVEVSNFCRTDIPTFVALWPMEVPQTLVEKYGPDTAQLEQITLDPLIHRSKRPLVRLLDADAPLLWRLRREHPEPYSYVNLLFHQDGQIHAPSIAHSAVIGNPFSQLSSAARPAPSPQTSEACVLTCLWLANVEGDHRSYQALQHIVGVEPATCMNENIASYVRAELKLLVNSHRLPLPPLVEDWTPPSSSFHIWSVTFTRSLGALLAANKPKWAGLALAIDKVAEGALAPLVHLAIQESRHRKVVSAFIAKTLDTTSDTQTLAAVTIIVRYLRHFKPTDSDNDLTVNGWLTVSFVKLAWAAVRARMYVSALLFWEISREENQEADDDVSSCRATIVISGMLTFALQLLFEIYSQIDEPDGFYTVPSKDMRQTLLRRSIHERKWDIAFRHEAADFENQGTVMLPVLGHMGMHRLSLLTSQAASKPTSFATAWRTGSWDLPQSLLTGDGQSVYAALKAIHRNTPDAKSLAVVNLSEELQRLAKIEDEDMKAGREGVRNLLCLKEILDWFNKEPMSPLPPDMRFAEAELVLSTRLSLLGVDRARYAQIGDMVSAESEVIRDTEHQVCLNLARLARQEKNINVAAIALKRIPEMSPLAESDFAEVLWMEGERSLAIDHIKQIIRRDEPGKRRSTIAKKDGRTASLLALLGHWSMEARQADASLIRREYFEPAVAVAGSGVDELTAGERATIFIRFATFADNQQKLMAASPDVTRLRSYSKRKHSEMSSLKTQVKTVKRNSGVQKSLSARLQQVQDEMAEDEKAIQRHEQERLDLVLISIEMYASALSAADSHDDAILKLVALWMQHSGEDNINRKLDKSLVKIPSHKYLQLDAQLIARLNDEGSPFQSNLVTILDQLASKHPYHVLNGLIATATGVKTSSQQATSREVSAQAILKRLRASRSADLSAMEAWSNAAMQWAQYTDDRSLGTRRGLKIPDTYAIGQLRNLRVPIPTLTLEPDPTGQYDDAVFLQKYDISYSLAGGLHRPKVMTAIGSDGRKYFQLFKAEEDLRQDAVMEQVFGLVSRLLHRDRETRQRNLRFRTYNVVPLARQTGVIEFITNTIGIGDWLVPAHARYRPKDLTPAQFRTEMKVAQDANNTKELIRMFIENRKRFHPVMRHFFVEKYKDPMAWFGMRTTYSRSLAVGSMAGHILGLGDRHCSNIMIDRGTGELLHIDLGIAFEQGKQLPIPELVPFRLTNDLVDGLGSAGIKGIFQRCSEHTLRVLRESSELVMTVLEVLKHDPLQAWTLDRERVLKIQGSAAEEYEDEQALGSEKADRALATVASKLDTRLSVEYTVNDLIRQAQDPANLAVIFVGWQPWL